MNENDTPPPVPGPGLDSRIAGLMGWRLLGNDLWDTLSGPEAWPAYTGPAHLLPRTPHRPFRPSSEGGAALELMARLSASVAPCPGGGWAAVAALGFSGSPVRGASGRAGTAPLAVCAAALAAAREEGLPKRRESWEEGPVSKKVYIASASRGAALSLARDLHAAGHSVVSTWHDRPGHGGATGQQVRELSPGERADAAARIVREASGCDALVICSHAKGTKDAKGGAPSPWVAVGAALGAGRPVHVVAEGYRGELALWHPACVQHACVADLLGALAAG